MPVTPPAVEACVRGEHEPDVVSGRCVWCNALTNPVSQLIVNECEALKDMLLEKNKAYGNSAIDPVRIFSKADPAEQIRVRIDDKLSRMMRGEAAGEDVVLDLLGYLILLRVSGKMKERKALSDPATPR